MIIVLVVLVAIFGIRSCNAVKKTKTGESKVGNTKEVQPKTGKQEEEKAESKREEESIPSDEEEPGQEEGESIEQTEQEFVQEGMRITGYTKEMEKVMEVQAEEVAEKSRNWLDKNGYSGAVGLAFYDTIKITQSEQKYSVECQVLFETGNGNGLQEEKESKDTVLTMDYYKNRGLFQWHP